MCASFNHRQRNCRPYIVSDTIECSRIFIYQLLPTHWMIFMAYPNFNSISYVSTTVLCTKSYITPNRAGPAGCAKMQILTSWLKIYTKFQEGCEREKQQSQSRYTMRINIEIISRFDKNSHFIPPWLIDRSKLNFRVVRRD